MHHISCLEKCSIFQFIPHIIHLLISYLEKNRQLTKQGPFQTQFYETVFVFYFHFKKKSYIAFVIFFIDKTRPSLSIIIFLHSFCCLDPPVFIHFISALHLLFRSARLYPLYVCIRFAVLIHPFLSIICVQYFCYLDPPVFIMVQWRSSWLQTLGSLFVFIQIIYLSSSQRKYMYCVRSTE